MSHRDSPTPPIPRVPRAIIIGVLAVSLFAFVLSFVTLRHLAERAGVPEDFAFLMPLAIDVQTAVASWAWLHPAIAARARTAARKITYLSFAISIGGNALEHIIASWQNDKPLWMVATSVVVGTIPPVVMATTFHLASLIITGRSQAMADAAHAAADAEARQAEREARRATRATPPPQTATGSATRSPAGSATGSTTPNTQVNGHVTNGHTNGHRLNGHGVAPPPASPAPHPATRPRPPTQPAATPESAGTEPAVEPADVPVNKTAAIEQAIAAYVARGGDLFSDDLKGSDLAAKVDAAPQLGRRVLGRLRKAANEAQAAAAPQPVSSSSAPAASHHQM